MAQSKVVTPTYYSWANMKKRCLNPKATQFMHYGGRGIKVCDRWLSFANFLADMGERPEGCTLDRWPDVDGDYEPSNCRWATKEQQSQNRRDRKPITAFGRTLLATQWAAETGVKVTTMLNRLKSGWSPEDAVSLRPLDPKIRSQGVSAFLQRES